VSYESRERKREGRGKKGKAHLHRFLQKRKQEILQQLIRVLDPIRILPHDPNHRRLRIRRIKRVQVLTQRSNDPLVLVRVAPEDVLDDDDRFLDDVGHFGFHQREEDRDAQVGGGGDFDGEAADGAYGLADEFDVDFGGVPAGGVVNQFHPFILVPEGGQEEKGKDNALFQLRQHLLDVLLRRQPINDLQLCEFDVNRVIVLAEEHLDFVLQYGRSTLDDEVDVAEGDVLDFVAGGEEGDCGSE
jgi:hypothetical protein